MRLSQNGAGEAHDFDRANARLAGQALRDPNRVKEEGSPI